MKKHKVIDRYIYGYEPYFEKLVIIAFISHDNKEVRPTHGYFHPNPHSKYSKRITKKLGYNFNNN